MIKIITVFGTRPEAIKMAVLVKKLHASKKIRQYVCVTGQHRDMLDPVLRFFDIQPDHDLQIMKPDQELADISSEVIKKISVYYKEIQPDLVLVHGDTNSCFAAALAAFYMHIKVAHVEAGLRTYDLSAPFPEEANRILTSAIVNYHFAPTALNGKQLVKEGVSKKNIVVTGNTVIDSLQFTMKKVKKFSSSIDNSVLREIVGKKHRYILVTGHRRENFGKGLEQICSALKNIAQKYPDTFIIYPVHLNPNVSIPVKKILSQTKNILLTEPLGYADFIFLMKNAFIILTDSGGIQEEAPSLGIPVLVMRDITERPEALSAGTVKLVGTEKKVIVKAITQLIENKKSYKKMSSTTNPYGDGKATGRILKWIIKNECMICDRTQTQR